MGIFRNTRASLFRILFLKAIKEEIFISSRMYPMRWVSFPGKKRRKADTIRCFVLFIQAVYQLFHHKIKGCHMAIRQNILVPENKHGVKEALKLIYREYDRNNFLYDSDSRDFTILMNNSHIAPNFLYRNPLTSC